MCEAVSMVILRLDEIFYNSKLSWDGDHFVKLAVLWQLHLYYHIVGEGNSWSKPYFWGDIFEKVRVTNENGLSDGTLQTNFVKNACDAVQQDLTGFFKANGMLKEIDKLIGDYTSGRKTITASMIEEVVQYASKYPVPEHDFRYISVNSLNAFKNKLPVSGSFNVGVSGSDSKIISHGTWKNVVAFETYRDDKLTVITMPGTGDASNSSSKVPYPSGSTRIEAGKQRA